MEPLPVGSLILLGNQDSDDADDVDQPDDLGIHDHPAADMSSFVVI